MMDDNYVLSSSDTWRVRRMEDPTYVLLNCIFSKYHIFYDFYPSFFANNNLMN